MPNNLKNILVVDDEAGILSAVCRVIERNGYICKSLKSPVEVVPYLSSEPCDLMMLDIVMPGLSGLDLMKKVRKLHPNLPIIVMTGHATSIDADAAYRWGAEGFLAKPFSPEDLTAEISRISGTMRVDVGRKHQ
jgi:DNA-binding NtrC family response regulator